MLHTERRDDPQGHSQTTSSTITPVDRGAGASGDSARFTAIGFFPGLGSRAAYRGVGLDTIGSGFASVGAVYDEAAAALGLSSASSLTLTPANLPADPVERQGFIGAAVLTHNIAIHTDVVERGRRAGHPIFTAFTGESFGMLASAVAAGSLTIGEGVILARAFTPLLLAAANQRASGTFGDALEQYMPTYSSSHPPVAEPAHVIALRGAPEALGRVLAYAVEHHDDSIELHKRYSRHQANVYVRSSFIPSFADILRSFPDVSAEELKEPTRFLAHSRKMTRAREALDRFIDAHGIDVRAPHTPLISNSGGGFLLTGDHVRGAVLAMTNEVMHSQRTVELIDDLRPDLVIEIGRGGKSLDLLRDNASRPAAVMVSDAADSSRIVAGAALAGRLTQTIDVLRSGAAAHPDGRDIALLRDLASLAASEPAFARYLTTTACALAASAEHDSEPSAFREFRETLQFTLAHRHHLGTGELVVNARQKKRLVGSRRSLGRAYTELRILTARGTMRDREVSATEDTEALVIHFERPRRARASETARAARELLDSQPAAQRLRDAIVDHLRREDRPSRSLGATIAHADMIDVIIHQVTMFELLKQHRRGLVGQSHVFLDGSDPVGWLLALVAGGAVDPGDVIELGAHVIAPRSPESQTSDLVARLCERIRDATLPLLSPDGAPVLARHDLHAATVAVFQRGHARGGRRSIHLNASCTVIALGSASRLARLDTAPHANAVIVVRAADEFWHAGLNPALDRADSRVLLTSSPERRATAAYARRRNLLHTTVSSYVNAGETVVGFGEGGSESMTIFFRRDGGDEVLVRKVLSEALTTARWDPAGTGPMLPPFTKAKRQAEYLTALPDALRPFFPEVYDVVEREITLPDQALGERVCREVIYEMSYVTGDEVGQYVREHTPPAAIIARLYEEIIGFVHRNVHSERRTPSPGATIEEQYFRKIEDRLDLCRQTAPRTFGPALLDSERIVINGRTYRNYCALLSEFRANPAYASVLESRFHSLVIGDTNTENIKIGDSAPLLRAQELLQAGASDDRVARALSDITAESIRLKFLDPRAIGYRSDGADTRDDPMYDNKPWHNSIGHYDEMHNELFDLDVSSAADGTPSISIAFHDDNPYQRAYRVSDAVEHGRPIDRDHPRGIEDHFADVMSTVYVRGGGSSDHDADDPHWITRFVFTMGTHFTAMPPFHFSSEIEGTLVDSPDVQRRPIAIYCEGIKWLNWALEMLEGTRTEFLGVDVRSEVFAR
ncbi:hypothetical protein MN032_07625 [Agromyces atrinae]|uniref:hypothetical protein n=1 Tax=Agromyces atrinae TaxID=592376 RepID=UPI001F562691|nr:hypothetical protein [Agromyces atrinae]MCI2957556.1 hypothetical protein [Agromyces atrinae]